MSLTHGKAYGVCALLRDLLGPDKFQGVIKTLLIEHNGGLIREDDLIGACEAALGEKLDWFTADWIKGRSTFDYAITDARQTKDGWDIEVKRVGTGSFPALVELTTEQGEELNQRMDRTKEMAVVHFQTAGRLKTASVNPGGFYPDLDASNDVWPRKAQ
jgi:aminopeptidase N